MFWTRFDRTVHSVVFRLTARYALVFSLGAIALFGLAYRLLETGLKSEEREGIAAKLVELAGEYRDGGLQAVARDVALSTDRDEVPAFAVRVADSENRTLFASALPSWRGFEPRVLERTTPPEGGWLELEEAGDGRVLEVAAVRLPDGSFLEVGRVSPLLDRALERFREVAGVTAIPLVFMAVGAGWFLACRALEPVRQLSTALDRIVPGDGGARIPRPGTADEIDALVERVNRLLGRIETLVAGMRESLDNVAHDLRTPLTRLRGVAEVALTSGKDPEELREALADCLEETQRIDAMLRAIFDLSEAETGAMALHRAPCGVRGACEDVAELYRVVAEDRRVSLTVSVDEGLTVWADPVRLRQVIANLVDNAVKYTPEGGWVRVRANEENGRVVVRVEDSGPGIPEKEQLRVWERLYRADTSRSQRGLGLGLSLVRALVEAHGGEVGVRSSPGQGSVFWFCLLPADETWGAEAINPAAIKTRKRPQGRGAGEKKPGGSA